jgi:hypothetical protein
MSDQSFTTTFSVDQTPEEAFDAMNNVRAWRSEEIDGGTDQLGAEFTYRHEDVHRCRIRVTRSRSWPEGLLVRGGQLLQLQRGRHRFSA